MSMARRLDRSTLDAAIARGVGFLAREREADTGLWRDYVRPQGSAGSDVWASGFVAAHVGGVAEARPLAAAVASALLERHRPSGGWGYDQALLEDCDSTAWVLLAARHAGVAVPRPRLVAALRFVLRHQHGCGGFVTYGPAGVELFGHVAARDGWFVPQACVSAAALLALATHAPRELPATAHGAGFLRERRGDDGLWHAYWWHGPAYGTYHAVRALQAADRLPAREAEVIASALRRARCADGGWSGATPGRSTSFSTALMLLALCTLRSPSEPVEGLAEPIELLLDTQRSDGSFNPSAELLVPGGTTRETLTMIDRGLFTTACALHALDEVRRALEPQPRGNPS